MELGLSFCAATADVGCATEAEASPAAAAAVSHVVSGVFFYSSLARSLARSRFLPFGTRLHPPIKSESDPLGLRGRSKNATALPHRDCKEVGNCLHALTYPFLSRRGTKLPKSTELPLGRKKCTRKPPPPQTVLPKKRPFSTALFILITREN